MFVGIVCPNYSGSTVVGGILHRFDSVQHVGEIWKIFVERQRKKVFCFECRPKECSYFSNDFISDLQSARVEDIVPKLKEKFGAEIIVSGDKGPNYFDKYDGRPDKALILVKNKYSAALSYAKRLPGWDLASDDEKVVLIQRGAKEYFTKWMERVDWVEKTFSIEDYVFASPDVLCEASDQLLHKLGVCLFGRDLKLSSTPFDDKFHYIGGNHRLSKGNDPSFFKGEFRSDTRYMAEFNCEMYEAVDSWVAHNLKCPRISPEKFIFLEEWFRALV